MSDEWIKLRKKLLDDSRTVGIARRLGTSEPHILGCLVAMWFLADSQADPATGILANYCAEDIDARVRLKGFSEAVVDVTRKHKDGPWLSFRDNGAVFPNYGNHNGSTAKRRAQEAARKAVLRGDVRSVSATDADKKRAPLLLSTSDSAVEDKSHELPRAREVEHVPHFAATFLPHFPPVSSKGIGTAEAEREWASWTAEQRAKSIEAVKLYRAWWERIPPSRTKQAQEKPLKWLENFKARGFEPDDSWAKVPESSGVVTQGYRRADDTYQ